MLKPVAGLAAAGVITLILWKLLGVLLLPLVGIGLALVVAIIKLAVGLGAILLMVWLIRRSGRDHSSAA